MMIYQYNLDESWFLRPEWTREDLEWVLAFPSRTFHMNTENQSPHNWKTFSVSIQKLFTVFLLLSLLVSILPAWPCLWHCVCGLWPLERWWSSQRTEGRGTSSHCSPRRSWAWWGGSCWWCCTCWGWSRRWSRAGWIWSGWAALKERAMSSLKVAAACAVVELLLI